MTVPPPKPLLLADYTYELPPDRIAVRPVAERDLSRLLVVRKQPIAPDASPAKTSSSASYIEHATFRDLPSYLPEHSLIVINTSKVFRARIAMRKPTGGSAEVLLLAPVDPLQDPLESNLPSTWQCLIRGRHIAAETVLQSVDGLLTATVISRNGTEGVVELKWESHKTLAKMLERTGELPLPPYLGREAEDDDTVRYQTVYADKHGSAAAPTAGLHFTDAVFAELDRKHIEHVDLSLHVGLGTFKPIEVEDARDHVMHTERITIHRDAIEQYVSHALSPEPFVTVVGTTSLRAMESVYWFGVGLIDSPSQARASEGGPLFHVEQWAAFQYADSSSTAHKKKITKRADAFAAVLQWMNENSLDTLQGATSIMLAPGCHIATADALVTNFHQPGNSLLLLVAAFCGNEDWRKIYDAAMKEGYRFLSYGDSSLIIRGV